MRSPALCKDNTVSAIGKVRGTEQYRHLMITHAYARRLRLLCAEYTVLPSTDSSVTYKNGVCQSIPTCGRISPLCFVEYSSYICNINAFSMEITGENILLVSSVLLIAGVMMGKSSYRTGLPLLLVFLFVGMLFGVDGLGVHFNDMHTAQFVGILMRNLIQRRTQHELQGNPSGYRPRTNTRHVRSTDNRATDRLVYFPTFWRRMD